ncbi:phosphonate ABC transporter, permease protein PhnE [Dinghuibacter silviterrae]|uniref:Phosphonate transport system permease protein n=1 Tax=Dinghuibacter silviterrae TaxID=1539049 RepID=A0A4R8DRL1_9BACT|nr:phosphonate ABC transporter, permease protein PhnE [Dinghuibacter silviterrae]TDX00844.1 phosphonate transport system permease protein [Dinghuibacter silviterrae]
MKARLFLQRATVSSLLALILLASFVYMGVNPGMLFTEFHYVVDLAGSMSPPHFSLLWMDKTIAFSVLETLSMAFLGTLAGGMLAVGCALLTAKDTMPYPWIRGIARFMVSLVRVIPSLVMVLIFVVTVGLGAFAGMLTLVLSTMGTFGQLFTEVIEATEKAPAEAIFSVGATRWQVIRFGILPQVLPSLTANFFYAFDVNVRSAVGLGIFGGGGVGFQLFLAMRVLHYRDAFALICVIVLLIVLTEKLSDGLRRRLIGRGRHRQHTKLH